jgi:hypothetical protein
MRRRVVANCASILGAIWVPWVVSTLMTSSDKMMTIAKWYIQRLGASGFVLLGAIML